MPKYDIIDVDVFEFDTKPINDILAKSESNYVHIRTWRKILPNMCMKVLVNDYYYYNGKLHHDTEPAHVDYGIIDAQVQAYKDFTVLTRMWYSILAFFYQYRSTCCLPTYPLKPSIRNESWYQHGELYRDNNKPNVVRYDNRGTISCEWWFNEGYFHNEAGPALVEYYYHNHQILCEEYYINGEYHNIKGPARIIYTEDGEIASAEWWVNGKSITEHYDSWPISIDEQIKLKLKYM